MKRTIKLFYLICITSSLYAQPYTNVRYTYDNAGNRITRQIIQTQNKRSNSDTIYMVENNDKPYQNLLTQADKNVFAVVFPNPVKEILQLSLHNTQTTEPIKYAMFDLYGREVLNTESNSTKVAIDVSQLPDGVYTLQFKLNNKIIVHRVNKFRR